MKGRFFRSSKVRIRCLHGRSLQRRRRVLLVAAQNLSRRRGTKNIYVWTGRLSVLFSFHLKPLTINADGDAGVPSGLHGGRFNPYPAVWSRSTASATGGPIRRRLIDRDVESDSLKKRKDKQAGDNFSSHEAANKSNQHLPGQRTAEKMTTGETGIRAQKEQ